MAGNMDTASILNLPSEVARLTASFLSSVDALHFTETCKTLHSKLSLHLLRDSFILFRSKVWSGDRRGGHKDIPFLHILCRSHHVHSIILTFRWHDQGWGNSAGGLWVIKRKSHIPPDPSQRFYGGQVVWESALAPKDKTPGSVMFLTSPDEIYQLWFRVGMGGGHELHLHDGRLHMLVFDDDQKNILASYKSRERANVIAEKPQAEFGPLNVDHVGIIGIDVF